MDIKYVCPFVLHGCNLVSIVSTLGVSNNLFERSLFREMTQHISTGILGGIPFINTSQNPCQTVAVAQRQVFLCFLSYQNRFSLAN